MDAAFWLKLVLSFIVGSLWVTFTTLSAEQFGSKIGGLIGGLPSTVVIALLFIGITQSAQVAAQTTTVMPLAQGVNGLFVLTFMALSKRRLSYSLVGALLVWLLLSTIVYMLDIQAFWLSLLGWIILFAISFWIVERRMIIASKGALQITYTPGKIILRALFGGTVIAWAVFIGKIGGPLLGGIFGSFPAMFLSTLLITRLTGGADFSRSVGKSLLISGLVNVPLYEIIVRLLYPVMGLGFGTALALIVIMGTGYLTFLLIKTKFA